MMQAEGRSATAMTDMFQAECLNALKRLTHVPELNVKSGKIV
jgi:hypothetical protein